MNRPREPFLLFIPAVTVFISSFCIMVLELVAARLIARHLGSSLYTWTAVIGVVLLGITVGNYLGGRIADRYDARKSLSVLFGLCSGACVLTVILNNVAGEWLWLWQFSWPVRVFGHVSLVFLLPSTLLGTISPLVAKMALDRGLPTGRTVGGIYAWGAAGSIAGTFATGYYLIMVMGTIAIVWAVGGILLVMAILYRIRFWPLHLWMLLFVFVTIVGVSPAAWCRTVGGALRLREEFDPKVVYRAESQYCLITVKQLSERPDRRVFIQDKFRDSDVVMGDIDNLQYFYTSTFAAITKGLSEDRKTLSIFSIGGGGYVFPRYVERHWPGSRIDVAEIDPGVTEAAMEAFGLSRDTTINTIHLDARNYLDQLLEDRRKGRSKVEYDFIYEDAFSDFAVPYQLATKEFNEKVFKVLSDTGVYIVNMIDIYDSSKFLGAYVNTLEKTFPFVYVVSQRGPTSIRLTFSIVGSKEPLDVPGLFAAYGHDLKDWHLSSSEIAVAKKRAGNIVLTDDYVPVENMLAPVVRQSAGETLGWKYMDRAEDFARQSRFKESIKQYKMAARANPQLTVMAFNQIGLTYAQQGDLASSIGAFRTAVDYEEHTAEKLDIASIHMNLGIALQKLDRQEEARVHFLAAAAGFRDELKQFPDSAELHTRLGDTLASLGDFKGATEPFRRAVELEPRVLVNYYNLGRVLEFQGLYEQAIVVAEKGVVYFQKAGQAEPASQLRSYLSYLKSQGAQQKK
ncbi:MAG: fused MFS/spermidine synthase [Sedimentisphaerales bacterium]|nr:fused MFS/spermidine synthase [Sedimentisphaerales bacterium]